MATYNFVLQQGCDFTRVLAYQDSEGHAINLTGYTAKMDVRGHVNKQLALDLTPTVNGPAGTITISVPHSQVIDLGLLDGTKTLTENAQTGTGPYGVYDLLITSPGGVVSKLLEGQMVIVPVITA